eukprot:6180772-Pleurochrysis_carterae.AAC.3
MSKVAFEWHVSETSVRCPYLGEFALSTLVSSAGRAAHLSRGHAHQRLRRFCEAAAALTMICANSTCA